MEPDASDNLFIVISMEEAGRMRGIEERAGWRWAYFGMGLILIAAMLLFPGRPEAKERTPKKAGASSPLTPIRHVIIVVGENRSFDNLFATYRPLHGQHIRNLLSEGIVTPSGDPWIHFGKALQMRARNEGPFLLDPPLEGPFKVLPVPDVTYAAKAAWGTSDPSLVPDPGLFPSDQFLLKTGGAGLPHDNADTRFPANLPPGPFQITHFVPYDSYTGDPIHRFFQMWQQSHFRKQGASSKRKTEEGHDLYTWVAVQVGNGGNGNPPSTPFGVDSTHQGGVPMGFYNMETGDAPYFKWLADHFSLADNYHQAIMGGTGPNHVAIGTGDVVWYQNGKGRPIVPPAGQIENPDAMNGTNNWYIQDGYSGGAYVNCSDSESPGVKAILSYLTRLPYRTSSRCAPHHYYMVNNNKPGFHRDGRRYVSDFFVPPSSLRTIGDELSQHEISWGYFGEGFHPNTPRTPYYCNICNPFQYASSIMTTPLIGHLGGLGDFYRSIEERTLPAVSIVKPDALLDGHPAYGKPGLFEGFVRKLVDTVRRSPYWNHTAIFVTFDEGGGYYDSGYIQSIDFFGDGPRVPFFAISPYSRGGTVVHAYFDHVSLLKFIERNWALPPLTSRSRDNLPDPIARKNDPYVPVNNPAIGDLMEMFHFPRTRVSSQTPFVSDPPINDAPGR